MNTVLKLSLFSLFLCFSTGTSQESVELLKLHELAETFGDSGSKALPFAVQVKNEYLQNVSASLLLAETWVRAHVLAFYPSKNVTTILVGETILCKKDERNDLSLILPSLKNIHYSLTRWGLHNDIKVAPSFASKCLDSKSETYLSENHIKSLLETLRDISSPFIVNPSPNHYLSVDEHLKSMKSLGMESMDIMTLASSHKDRTFIARRGLSIDFSSLIDPFPTRPTPFAPTHAPAFAANSPLPPLIGTLSPELSPSFLPHLAPMVGPSPPFGPHLPPCNPPEGGGGVVGVPPAAPRAAPVHHNGVWCVAKPSVPAETLQEALDYACGEGGADCEEIGPNGSCYYPDNLVAHASYAFNSYWQKSKGNGGSCGFGGTAMLITSDPSYRHCRFVLN